MQAMLSPSMMCVDFSLLPQTLRQFEENGIEYLHLDIMDGEFVPNYTLGVDFCNKLRNMTSIPLDFHLMVVKPDEKIDWFDFRQGDCVSIHYESTIHIQRILSRLKDKGVKTRVALNPATPICVLENILDVIDGVLIMTVNPGYAGQKLVPMTLDKIANVRKYLDERGYINVDIEVDGNVSFENIPKMRNKGADVFVGGSSSVFYKGDNFANNITKSRELLRTAEASL